MARSTGKGVLNFGMVSIPVKMFTTGNASAKVSFKQLGPQGQKLKQQYVDPDGNVVARSEMLKGHEFAKGQFITFTPDEVKAFAETTSSNIGIEEFVPAAEVASVYRAKSYYLAPDAGGIRAYGLLSKALQETGKVGLARQCARGKQYLVAIEAFKDGLIMHQLHYSDEVVEYDEVRVAPENVNDQEVSMAKMLIEQISNPTFDPSKYKDEVKARLEAAIDQKINGQVVTMPLPEVEKKQVIDLMDALKASLADTAVGA